MKTELLWYIATTHACSIIQPVNIVCMCVCVRALKLFG